MGQETQVAVFIDYDNIEISVEEAFGKNIDVDWNRIFNYATQIGRVVMRRAYADWAEAASKQRQLLNMGVELVHVNSKRGKNAADIRIVIDALELFYNEKEAFTHVLLVSGDGDFTELVHRLRAHGKTVIGLGVSGTTADFLVSACDKFVYYDKWQGVNKFKKDTPANGGSKQPTPKQTPPAQKQEKPQSQVQTSPPAKNGPPAPISPEKRMERYLNILSAHKIRMTPSPHRPLVIYKIYDLVKENPEITFNQLKELSQSFFANVTPKIEPQLALDSAHQLFHTYCFEFDSDTSERIMDRKMHFPQLVNSPSDLLNKCDQKLLQLIISDLGASESLDKEIAAQILYGGVRSPKVLDHIQELIEKESQV
ncbi:MAG: NYN domain-containing protein [Anaerolineales bacterium]|nr:NYN domain-containing protein [Anaerolineales bacterium]